ncbi:MAG: hypothetical protein ACJAXN_000036 [Psychromonas sp.]|jgi:hypothetical protein
MADSVIGAIIKIHQIEISIGAVEKILCTANLLTGSVSPVRIDLPSNRCKALIIKPSTKVLSSPPKEQNIT